MMYICVKCNKFHNTMNEAKNCNHIKEEIKPLPKEKAKK